MNDTDYMTLALQEARAEALHSDVPVGAVLVRDGDILCQTHNRREETHDPSAHAEILALREASGILARWNLSDCTLYVTLEPCPMCAGAIVAAHIGRVVYGAFHKEGGACGSRVDLTPLSPGTSFEGGLLHEESSALLRAFFAQRREAQTFY